MPIRPTPPPRFRIRVALFGLLALLAACQSSQSEPIAMKILARSTAPVTLGAGPTVVALAPAGQSLAAHLAALPPGRSLYLLVRGLTATEQPGVLYSLYLDLPAGARPAENDPRQVGILQFYNARPPGAANGPDAESPVNTDAEKVFFSFDVTAAAQALQRHRQLTERTTLTLIPDGAPVPGAKVVVGHLDLVEQ
jgi:hypothetical protein